METQSTGWTVFSVRGRIIAMVLHVTYPQSVELRILLAPLVHELHELSANYPGRPAPEQCDDVDQKVPLCEVVALDFLERARAICEGRIS